MTRPPATTSVATPAVGASPPAATASPAQWNRVRQPYDRRCVLDLIAAVVRDHPDMPAIEAGAEVISYRQLDERSDQVAQLLIAVGATAGDLIGVCVGRSIAQITTVVGILKTGCAVVPLDPAYPPDRVAFMLTDSGAAIVVTTDDVIEDGELAPVLQQVAVVLVDNGGTPNAAAGNSTRVDAASSPEAPVYMIYTSGSTGQPKGTVVSHAAIANLVAWHRRTWLAEPGTRVLLYSPISFDVAFHEIFAGLATGAVLVVVDEETRHNPMALLDFVREQRIQKWYMPFVALQQIAQAAVTGEAPTELVELIVGGEVLRVTPAMREFARRSGCVIHNHYGSTECIDVATYTLSGDPDAWPTVVPVGRANVDNMNLYILDHRLQPVAAGEVGEIYCDGDCLAEGYHRRPGLTAQRFVANPFGLHGPRLYRMGDLGRYRDDGTIECLGRADNQLKIRGFRIEPGEVEARLAEHPAVAECAVVAAAGGHGAARLIAYVVPTAGTEVTELPQNLRAELVGELPDHMVPSVVVVVEQLPLTPSGKLDRKALLVLTAPALAQAGAGVPTRRATASAVVSRIWCQLLEVGDVDPHKSFGELGADSLMLVHAHQRIADALGRALPANVLFRHPNIHALTEYLARDNDGDIPAATKSPTEGDADREGQAGAIAIIGMACRVPGADSISRFWSNLRDGVESITPLTSAELAELPAEQTQDPHFVPVAAALDGIDQFDAEFFGISPAEAAVIDPQQRLFLEAAWEAVEDAGLDADRDRVGVFAGAAMSTYLVNNVLPAVGPDVFLSHRNFDSAADMRIEQGNAGDHLPMRASFKLGLRGPSVNVQATCATSLVAVHLARQALLSGECDAAIAGGVSIITPQRTGYRWREGLMVSRDGHCRAFDAAADGTVFGNGLGVVVLKPLARAVADGDRIYAVVSGSAVNNDGADKPAYTGPNVSAQAEVITRAHRDAGVVADDITYVETHGTATRLGDPIEISALTRAFRSTADSKSAWCAIGSVKTNIGHLDEAAGVIGLIKTALSLHHRQIPASLHFDTPNPQADLPGSPFFVSTCLRDWPADGRGPRRAGVSSFGMGGTNCHLVVEEAPPQRSPARETAAIERAVQVLPISARTPAALRASIANYYDLLEQSPDRFADICFTAATTRRHFPVRTAITATDASDAIAQLRQLLHNGSPALPVESPAGGRIAFLCTGYGSQYPQMGRALYDTEPVFRTAFNRCDAIVEPLLDRSLTDLLYGPASVHAFDDPMLAHPALFAIGYALAALWESWGVRPDLLIGHSLGEYLAATLAGVLTVDDALRLIVTRAELVETRTPPGTMVQVGADEATVAAAVAPWASTVSIAAINGPEATVISGDSQAIEQIVTDLARRGIATVALAVSRALHSPLMAAARDPYRVATESVTYSSPRIDIIANATGDLAEPTDMRADYWVNHLTTPVRFTDALATAARHGVTTFIEIGPKPVLTALGQRCLPGPDKTWLPSMNTRDPHAAIHSLRQLYRNGTPLDWRGFHAPFQRCRVPLPTYPFQSTRHWIDRPSRTPAAVVGDPPREKDIMPPLQFLDLTWEPAPEGSSSAPGTYVVVGPPSDFATRLIAGLRAQGTSCAHISTSGSGSMPQVQQLSTELGRLVTPGIGLHVIVADTYRSNDPATSLLPVIEAAHTIVTFAGTRPVGSLWMLTGDNDLRSAGLAALARTITAEHPELACVALVVPATPTAADIGAAVSCLRRPTSGEQLAVRDGRLYRARLTARRSSTGDGAEMVDSMPIRRDGTYLITGGTGALGLQVALTLSRRRPARLVLLSRRGEPADDAVWQALTGTGVEVEVVRGDVADETMLRSLVDRIGPTLRGIVHCAAVLDDGIFLRQSQKRMESVLAAKVRGAWLLHQLTRDIAELDFFVLFSSLAAVVGYQGQAAYAAANGVLCELARHRHRHGLPALAVSWGSWAGKGMTGRLSDTHLAQIESDGEQLLDPTTAAAALTALPSQHPHVAVATMDWDRFAATRSNPTPVLDNLTSAEPSPPLHPDLPGRAKAVTTKGPLVMETVTMVVAELLGVDADRLDLRRGFSEQGLDSLTALDLRARLQTRLGVRLPATVAFDHPNVHSLADHLADLVPHFDAATEPDQASTVEPVELTTAGKCPAADALNDAEDQVAIIGMAIRFPGADTTTEFWDLLCAGTDMVATIPGDRWDVDAYYDPSPHTPGKMNVRCAATLGDIDSFDARFFGISPREAARMDPRHRMLLETVWHAVEDAAIDPTQLRGSDTGVFVGADEFLNDHLRGLDADDLGEDPYVATGATLSMTAGRLSHALGCHGPSMVLATACSSGLVAVHTAVASIRRGECGLAIVGSGKLLIDPMETVQLCKTGALAPDGRSKAFSADANGFGRGEGIAALVLKRLDRALADGEPIHAVIRGSAINHDGPSSGLTVPNGTAQVSVIRNAIADAGVTPDQVGYVETHGTGTQLGDPIELNALAQVFTGRPRPVLVGSVKANIGHLEEAAGLAGLIKTVLTLQAATIAPQPHCERLNTNIDWSGLPVQVPHATTSWPSGAPRIAGVSAFGMSGTNAHLIVEAAPSRQSPPRSGRFVYPVSARDQTDLRGSVRALAAALTADTDPSALAYTLQVGRHHYAHRLAIVATSIEELRTHLRAVLTDTAAGPEVQRGGPDTAGSVPAPTRDAVSTARAWCQGQAIDWAALYDSPPQRISVPGYPFRRDQVESRRRASAPAATSDPAPQQAAQPDLVGSPALTQQIHEHVAALLGYTPDTLDPSADLQQLGADSMIYTRIGHYLLDQHSITITFDELFDEANSVDAIYALVTARQRPGPRTNPTDNHPTSPVAAPQAAAAAPIHRAGPGMLGSSATSPEPLTGEQERFVREFVSAYADRTAKSKAAAEHDMPVMANCRAGTFQPALKEMTYPIVAARSQGARFWDLDGNEYLDVSMGYGVHFFGYNPDFLDEALRAQLDEGVHIGPQAAVSGQVARTLCQLTGTERAVFSNSGTEAVSAALRFARAATGRSRFVMFAGSYHGWSDATLALPAGVEKSLPMSRGIGEGAMGDVTVVEYGIPESLETIRGLGPNLAAVLVEPVQSRRPDLQPDQFLRELRSITHHSGTALIFDEVITGFRLGPRGAQGWSGVDADLVVYGKILGGGLPIGAVAGKAAFLDTVDGGAWTYGDTSCPAATTTFFGGTFNKNPLAMAAASAVLTRLQHEGPHLQDRVAHLVSRLAEEFNRHCRRQGFPMKIVAFSSIFRFITDGDYRLHRSPLALDLFFALLAHYGIYVLETRVCFLSTAHTSDDVVRIVETAKQCLQTLRDNGFFPASTATARGRGSADDTHVVLTLPATSARPPQTREALVTGATGFLGPHLVKQLLEQTSARITCLVRAHDNDHARGRLLDALTRAGIAKADWDPRVTAVAADLTRPRLGLSAAHWDQLADRVDDIYHCAAEVHSLHPYQRLAPANVEGTRELIQLAADVRPSRLHYISTDAVFDAHGYHRHRTIHEDQPLAHHDSIYGGGYAETKWVAETLVADARSQGLLVAIYRPGALLGSTDGDAGQPGDFLIRFLRGIIALGVCPDLDATIDLVPVDYAAELVVALSQAEPAHRTFHLTHPDPITYTQLIEALSRHGYPLRTVALHEWDTTIAALRHEHDNALYPLVPLFTDSSDPYFRTARLDVSNSRATVAARQIHCPPLLELIPLYLTRLHAQQLLPTPNPSIHEMTVTR
ncbi:amino acid adenylation domain-containing protein [Nocardia sp. NBC_01730]|uniref:polyketide synthase n=1 Tax=Nocardia sp. NBC_01730 TaxID=2975998 RepID=UPI002E0F1626|nr:polyketide synthase [Nocardia sp. NBC_01730]WSG60841.1 amino acid adenylation domain-containing protein [Nocardia sp. NBC_01730]